MTGVQTCALPIFRERYKGDDIETLIYLTRITLLNSPADNCIMQGDPRGWDALPANKSLFTVPEGHGLPIGNITSQLVANFLLDETDHYLTETLGLTIASAFAEEKENGGILAGSMARRECMIHFINKMFFYGAAGFALLVLNIDVVMRLFGFPMRGSRADLLLLCGAFIFCLLGFGALLGILSRNVLHAIQWLMALTYPFFILSGFSWPHSEMPGYLVQAAQVLPSTHFLDRKSVV